MVLDTTLSFHWWEPVSSISISLSFIIGVVTFIISTIEKKRGNNRQEIEMYLKLKSDFMSDNSKLLSGSIIDGNIFIKHPQNGIMTLYCIQDGVEQELSIDLLDHIEDLYLIYSKDLISKSSIISGFGSTINLLNDCPEIQHFIRYIRERNRDQDLYSGFRQLSEITK